MELQNPSICKLGEDAMRKNRGYPPPGQGTVEQQPSSAEVAEIKELAGGLEGIPLRLPPLTKDIKIALRTMTTGDGREKVLNAVRGNKMTPAEVRATAGRLDLIARQIDLVETVEDGGYMDLWNREDSPLTLENCVLRRVVVSGAARELEKSSKSDGA
jgi:hypothetical protein